LATTGLKNFEDTFIRFGATHERDRQTDRHSVPAYTALMHTHRAVKIGETCTLQIHSPDGSTSTGQFKALNVQAFDTRLVITVNAGYANM